MDVVVSHEAVSDVVVDVVGGGSAAAAVSSSRRVTPPVPQLAATTASAASVATSRLDIPPRCQPESADWCQGRDGRRPATRERMLAVARSGNGANRD